MHDDNQNIPSYLRGLNPQQQEAALHTSGPLMILAGAGAGKTKTITHRIAHLVATGTPASSILAVTFTNKAAGEMRGRVEKLLAGLSIGNMPLSAAAEAPKKRKVGYGGPHSRLPFVSTFHALGVRLLRENAIALDIPRSFSIWDRADSIRAVKAALTALGLEKQYEAKHILGRISKSKGDAATAEEFEVSAHTPWERTVARLWHEYEAALKREHALDFDDLLVRTLRMLEENPDILNRCQSRWTHLLVDEYQDTNRVQYELARLLAGEQKNICVVGDIDQNIYSWRGADIGHLLSFEKVFPGAHIVLLEQNYRSTSTIIGAANEVIAKNQFRHEKNLFTENPPGEPIVLYHALSETDEALFAARESSRHIQNGIPPNEIAVLYRANFQSRALEEAFLHAGIPYRVLGTRFFERKEVKDILSYLRAGLNPESRADIARIIGIPARGIGKATLARMLSGEEEMLTPAARKKVGAFRALLTRIGEAAQSKRVSETLRIIITESGLESLFLKGGEEGSERMENIKELVTLATKYDHMDPPEGAEKLLEDAALATEQDSLDNPSAGGARSVSLMTVHASKGLEFDVVFIAGLEEGLFPHSRHNDGESDPEEERRLFYVALTRARKQVYLVCAATRMMYGTREISAPSEFLQDINPKYIHETFSPHLSGDADETYEEPEIV
jgi:DNA helicase-2/ATP-dependent DNA helicase PcrA